METKKRELTEKQKATLKRGYHTLDDVLEDLNRWKESFGGSKKVKGTLKLYIDHEKSMETWERTWPAKAKMPEWAKKAYGEAT